MYYKRNTRPFYWSEQTEHRQTGVCAVNAIKWEITLSERAFYRSERQTDSERMDLIIRIVLLSTTCETILLIEQDNRL